MPQLSDQHGIRELHDPKRMHRVIILRPQLEGWLIDTAKDAGIAVRDFGLTNLPNDLHKKINFKLKAVAEW